MRDLLSLQNRVDRYENGAGCVCSETGDDVFRAFFEVDADALAACDIELQQGVGKLFDTGLQAAVGKGLPGVAKCDCRFVFEGALGDQVVEEHLDCLICLISLPRLCLLPMNRPRRVRG